MATAFPDTTRRLRLGVWGLGRGLHLARSAQACHFDLVAGCDFSPGLRDLFQQENPTAFVTAEVEAFLQEDLDAVLVATFLPNHAADAIRCLEAGLHVLCEVTPFFTPAEGVALIEAVEKSGKVYQLAENYPFSAPNRYLKQLWHTGFFGQLQYAEYNYVHDCLNYAFIGINGEPLAPGDEVHAWRSWLPWHYYGTHSLGPVMAITGERPVRVTALPGRVQLPGHWLEAPEGLGGMAPSLIEMGNGGLVRNLMGGCTHDENIQSLWGTRGASRVSGDSLSLRLGGRGHSPMMEVTPPRGPLDEVAAATGHGGGDFWVLYHFADTLLHGAESPFDVYRAADLTLPGIQAYRAASEGGGALEVPDFRSYEVRAHYRGDDFRPSGQELSRKVFPASVPTESGQAFTRLMHELIGLADTWQAFAMWRLLGPQAGDLARISEMGQTVHDQLVASTDTLTAVQALIEAAPDSAGARLLTSQLARMEAVGKSPQQLLAELETARQAFAQSREAHEVTLRQPQLSMQLDGFEDLPELTLPHGYTLRPLSPGEEDTAHWERIIAESFAEKIEYRSSMVDRPDYAPERILFIANPDGLPVATAAAYGSAQEGYVHYVGVCPSEQGKGLGYLVNLAVLHAFRVRGCTRAILDTDDPRLPAIKTYYRLGFRPRLHHSSHPARWRALARQLNLPELALPA